MTFQGSLAELPLPDIIQLVAVSGKTGRFDLTHEREHGQIFVQDGQIVHARTGNLAGEEAVYELAIWPIGDFVFTQDRVPRTVTIEKSNTNLLMEAARRIDEWQVLSKRIPSARKVPVFKDRYTAPVSLSPGEWAVVSKIDGRRTIEEISAALAQSPFETCKHLYGLITSGLVALGEDLSERFGARIAALTEERARDLIETLYRQTKERLEQPLPDRPVDSDPAATDDLGRALQAAQVLLQNGRPADAAYMMLRAAERAIADNLGDRELEEFLDRTHAQLP